LAESSSQRKLLELLAEVFALPRPPRRIEGYDNSHIQGSNAVGAMIVAGPEGFQKNQYRKFNIRAADLVPGDDFGMMREGLNRGFKRRVQTRRFKRRMSEARRPVPGVLSRGAQPGEPIDIAGGPDGDAESPWPDLSIIDGGRGEVGAGPGTLAAPGVIQ